MQYHRGPPWVKCRNFMLKFFIKVFRSLYLLNMLMDQVDTLHVGLKFYAFTTHLLSDLEVKVMGHRFDKFSGKAQVRRATLSCDSSYNLSLCLSLSEKNQIRLFWSRKHQVNAQH